MRGHFASSLLANLASSSTEPDYFRTAMMVDATGQSNGTGYTTEASRNAFAITYSGGATITSGKFEFEGTNSYLSLPHSILWTPGSKFTLGVFGLQIDKTTGNQGVISQYSADSGLVGWNLSILSGSLAFGWSTTGTSTNNSMTIATLSVGPVYDIVVCWDGATVYALVNGVQTASVAFTGTHFDTSQPLRFGCQFDAGAPLNFLDGRFTAAYFTRGETLFNKTSTYPAQTLPLKMSYPALTVDNQWGNVMMLVGYDSGISRIRDFGPYDLPLTLGGNVTGSTSITLGDGTPSISFDGTGDWITTSADDALLEPGASPLTVEAITRHAVINANHDIITKYNATGSQRSFILGYTGNSNIMQANLSSNGTALTTASGTFTATADTFEHKAACLTGANAKVFANGTQVGTDTAWSSTLFNSTMQWAIGTRGGGGADMNGYGTQYRVTKNARYPANFTPPTGILPTPTKSEFKPASLFSNGEIGDVWVFDNINTDATTNGAAITVATGLVQGRLMEDMDPARPANLTQVNGRWTARFTGPSDRMMHNFGSSISMPGTIIMCLTNSDVSTHVIATGSSTPMRWQISNDSGDNIIMYAGSTLDSTLNAPLGTKVITAEFNGASSVFRANGVQTATGNAGSFQTDQLTIGAWPDGTVGGNMDIYSVLFINRLLTATERDNVERWMGSQARISW